MGESKEPNVMSTPDAQRATKRDLKFMQGGAQVEKQTGQLVLTDEQEADVRSESKEGGRLPKGVIEIDDLTGPDLAKQIKESKIMLGSKAEVAAEMERVKVNLRGVKITEAHGRDCWAYQVPSGDARKSNHYYQVRIMFVDNSGQVGVVDFATEEGGFGGINSAMNKAGFNNQCDKGGIIGLVEDAGFDKVVTRLTTEV
ncbi:MAG: hypothetical protein EXS55_04805 [Candidatus Magasanikbacteria bacterium]|nr:hypothetical protein [Candidatus Magasanikbacteria bacterium]